MTPPDTRACGTRRYAPLEHPSVLLATAHAAVRLPTAPGWGLGQGPRASQNVVRRPSVTDAVWVQGQAGHHAQLRAHVEQLEVLLVVETPDPRAR
eukprot:8663246-Lingulodinium_polyedra.AAC.1